MRVKASIVLSVIALVAVIFAMPALSDDTKALETRAKLETLIDRYIASCGAKSEMLNSRSENIRRSAVRSCRIANFCVTSKEALVKEMLEKNIEPKLYKVSQFLNEQYRVVVLAKE